MFPSDGRNHKNAIKNEHNTKAFLEKNARKIFPQLKNKSYEVLSKGGTQYKADNIIKYNNSQINISDKEKVKLFTPVQFDQHIYDNYTSVHLLNMKSHCLIYSYRYLVHKQRWTYA